MWISCLRGRLEPVFHWIYSQYMWRWTASGKLWRTVHSK